MTTEPITIFIGFDERQSEAFKACKQSLLETASGPVEIYALKHQELRDLGFFTRPWNINEKGAFTDLVDGKPFSTQFSHSRFLVPYLANLYNAGTYSVFVDSDFIFLTDIHQVVKEITAQKRQPVYCVKHDYQSDTDIKMDGRNQFNYNKKLWTAFMVFETRHPSLAKLSPYEVNTMTGRDLHQFKWLGDSPEEKIGSLAETWNFIPNHSDKNVDPNAYINAIHYTLGTPHIEGYENCDYCDFYWGAYARALATEAKEIADSRFKILNVKNS